MLGRVGTKGERPLFNWRTRWDTRLIRTSGSVTISEAFSTRSLFMGEPGNREIGRSSSNGITFSGSWDLDFSLKTDGCGDVPEVTAGPGDKPKIGSSDKP
jgi:hypothetical protein